MKKLFVLFLFISPVAFGQTVRDTLSHGNVVIEQSRPVKDLLENNIALNEQKKSVPGYRIQLASSNNRKSVTDIKNTFAALHPEIKVYLTYQQPNFKLRVGDFDTRMQAYRLLQELSREFDSAFIVTDDISLSEE